MGIEYTQVFTYTAVAAGLTGIQYFQLSPSSPPAGSVFVVKYLSISSTSGISGGSSGVLSAEFITTSSDISDQFTFYTAYDTVSANLPILVCSGYGSEQAPSTTQKEFILTQVQFGVNVNMTAAGTFTVTISYSLIPSTNPVSAYFKSLNVENVPAGISRLITPSTVSTYIIKNVTFMNNVSGMSCSVQPVLVNNSNVIQSYIGESVVLDPNESTGYFLPIYIQANSTTTIGIISNQICNAYISYTVDN